MALTNSQYDTIIKGFEAKQNRNRKLLEERTAYVYSHVAGYQELDETVSSVSVAQDRRLRSRKQSLPLKRVNQSIFTAILNK